jgi:hypothetical protein
MIRGANGLFCVALASVCLSSAVAAADPLSTAAPTERQTTIFAEMVDATPTSVNLRLQRDAALGPLVVAAADAREARKHTGTALVVAGGIVLGVSDVVGPLVILTTPGYPYLQSQDTGRVVVGLAVALVGIGVGLGLGIPGVFKLAKHSDEENRAVETYGPPTAPQSPAPVAPPSAPPPPAAQPFTMMNLPIVSFTF